MSDFINKIQTKLANKSANYWAQMRNTLHLTEKSEYVDEFTIDSIRSELSDILDSGILSYPHTLNQVGLRDGMSLEDKKLELGIKKVEVNHDQNQIKFINSMAHKADQVRRANWSWRISEEAEQKQKLGWHPFFVTLTVDPLKADPKTIWTGQREFRKYIRRLANVVCNELGHPPSNKPPYRPESDYITYAGVIEHGKSREHHHGHFLIWLRAIPPSWRTCPNAGIRNPANRTRNECKPMRTYWEWSSYDLSPALYFRTVGDIWEIKYKFDLPLKDGKPMKISVPRVAGNYITKYLQKEHKEWHHRMKATRNLGMSKLRQTIRTIDQSIVEALTWRPHSSSLNLSLMKTHSVPLGLLRSEAKRQLYLMRFRQNQLELTNLLQSNIGIFTKMLKSVKAGARPDRMDSNQFFDWVGSLLPVPREYSSEKLITAHCYIATEHPPDSARVKHTKLPGNDIGHS